MTDTPTEKVALVLIVEDDDFLRSLAVTKLQSAGFEVEVATDGPAGLDKIKELNPKILLLDIMLPEMNGFEILEKLRDEKHPNLETMHILIFSNLGSEEDIRRGTELGAHDYLVKSSFTLDELVEKVVAASK